MTNDPCGNALHNDFEDTMPTPGFFTSLARPGLTLLAAALLWLAALPAQAQQEEDEDSALYVPLPQALVVNYGGPGRLKYLRAEVSIQVTKGTDANIIRHHMPLLRHHLVMLFSRQEEQAVNSQSGRQALRETAAEELNRLLKHEEDREDIVREVLFRNFVVQS